MDFITVSFYVGGRYQTFDDKSLDLKCATNVSMIRYANGAARPADCVVRVMANAIAKVGAMMEKREAEGFDCSQGSSQFGQLYLFHLISRAE